MSSVLLRRTPERAAIVAKIVADRNAIRARLAAALDPALLDAAERVRAALVVERYDATVGKMENAHCVVVRHVTSDDLAAVDAITQRAADPCYGDCRHHQSYITIRCTFGRAIEMHERWIRRRGEDGIVVVVGADGSLTDHGTNDARPLTVGGYDD